MNERTEALAKQAAEYAIEFATQDQELYIPKLLEKFAELIVKECIKLCDQVDLAGADDCIDKIKDYFEVDQ